VPVAIALSFCCKGQCFGHVLAHDVGFEKQGVGVILAERAFRSALARGLTRFDMLAPEDDFKTQWACGRVGVDDWAVPLTLRGRAYVALWLAGPRAAVKRLIDTAPPWLVGGLARILRVMRRRRR
jgi:CelD/BcsL family acetyltransferase involved in cellulose biosynthesis